MLSTSKIPFASLAPFHRTPLVLPSLPFPPDSHSSPRDSVWLLLGLLRVLPLLYSDEFLQVSREFSQK